MSAARLGTNLLNPATEMKPLLPVQDKFSHWTRVQRGCRNSREVSLSFAQYGCRLRWVYCRGSQQCWFSSLQVCANLHRSGSVRWFRISWMSYIRHIEKQCHLSILYGPRKNNSITYLITIYSQMTPRFHSITRVRRNHTYIRQYILHFKIVSSIFRTYWLLIFFLQDKHLFW